MSNSEASRVTEKELMPEPSQNSHPLQNQPQDEYAKSQNKRALEIGLSRKGKEKGVCTR